MRDEFEKKHLKPDGVVWYDEHKSYRAGMDITKNGPGNRRKAEVYQAKFEGYQSGRLAALRECEKDAMHINAIADRQYDWVERMGWHNKTVLEALALIASEVGEAVNECRGEKPTDDFGTELVDIILRTVDLAKWQGVDLAKAIADKMARNEANGTRGRRI